MSILLWLFIFLFLMSKMSWVACGQGGQVSLLFRSFSNPSSRTMSGTCCDPACADCNYYFVFCIRIDLTSSSCLLSGQTSTYHNYKHIVFTGGHSLGNGWKNPLSKSFTTWKGLLSFTLDIKDYDYFSAADDVDRFNFKEEQIVPTPWMESVKWKTISLGGPGHPSTMSLAYQVQCNANYYGPNCTKYCLAKDTDIAGHYTCDKTSGEWVCRAGWHSASCKVYCVPHDDDTHGHYTCESGTGRKVCLHGWYGSSCKVHCLLRNDSLAGFTCNSQGQKICLRNWFGKKQCNVYCKPTNDSTSGYACDAVGNKLCLQGWYGPSCDCKPRNDYSMGYTCNTTTGKRECLVGWFGRDCDVFCFPRNDSGGHYTCDSVTGAKKCLPEWFGENCTVFCKARNDSLGQHECAVNGSRLCARNWFGPSCRVFCAARKDNLAHFTCHPKTGHKICGKDWYGENCSTNCVPHDSDWFGHYNCSKIDGSKQCHDNWYGERCTRFCAPHDDPSGHYTCNEIIGSKVCLKNWFGSECKRYCIAMNDSQGHYYCSVKDGTKICLKNWHGPNCSVYCTPRNDSMGHYGCDSDDGSKICHPNFYGRNCSAHCVSKQSDLYGYYDCNVKDGSKICYRNWYGRNCSVHCKGRNDSQGHYECNAVDGSISCHQDWYGPLCIVHCRPRNNHGGHYICDFRTGRRICLPGWNGEFCDQETRPTTTRTIIPTSEESLWVAPTFPPQYNISEQVVVKLRRHRNGSKDLSKVLSNLKFLLAERVNGFCQTRGIKCRVPVDWCSHNRSAFNTDDILMEAKELSNQSLTIRLAVKLPPCVEGSFSARTLEKVVNMNKDAIENVTSADLQGVDVIIPSLQPGISSSEASKRRADGLPFSRSLLSYAIIASCVSVALILIAIAFWKFRRRRKTFARIIKVAPVDAEYWVTEDTFALVPGSTAEEKNEVGVVDDQDTCPSVDHPCAVDV